jgi:hypothetical protein
MFDNDNGLNTANSAKQNERCEAFESYIMFENKAIDTLAVFMLGFICHWIISL